MGFNSGFKGLRENRCLFCE